MKMDAYPSEVLDGGEKESCLARVPLGHLAMSILHIPCIARCSVLTALERFHRIVVSFAGTHYV
ncbi:MAG: hypothetical protein LZF86_110980 [Nitrospira sp.]|nr:MAG: hypothetical protein LZF86_110980 [Nitrospira sp.]